MVVWSVLLVLCMPNSHTHYFNSISFMEILRIVTIYCLSRGCHLNFLCIDNRNQQQEWPLELGVTQIFSVMEWSMHWICKHQTYNSKKWRKLQSLEVSAISTHLIRPKYLLELLGFIFSTQGLQPFSEMCLNYFSSLILALTYPYSTLAPLLFV